MPPNDAEPSTELDRSAGMVLVAAIFLLAICGLMYELIAGTLSSYLIGDSVTQFSLVIGLFLTAMGVGSFLSRFVERDLFAALLAVEIGVGSVGGLMAMACFATFSLTEYYVPVLLAFVFAIGTLVGLEIPLVVRILRQVESLRITLASVLSADYAGALVASLLFPFLLLPHLGVVRAGLVMGLMNVAVAGIVLRRFAALVGPQRRYLTLWTLGSGAVLLAAFAGSGRIVSFLENRMYADEIIYARDTRYQRLVLTRWRDDVRLFLDGHLQFSSVDEYRYHEALVHPAMTLAARRERVLILGGGDGLAAREVARYPDVSRIDLVDIDPVVTELCASHPLLTGLNSDVFRDPRLHVHNCDAMAFLQRSREFFDVILVDLPDPSGPELGKLFSRTFFSLAGRRLARGGMFASQCTSPFRSRAAFWCIVHTIVDARCGPGPEDTFRVRPYHTVVPTFGTWGFALAGDTEPDQGL